MKKVIMIVIIFVSFVYLGINQVNKNQNNPEGAIRYLEMQFNKGDYEAVLVSSRRIVERYGEDNVPEACQLYAESLEMIILSDLRKATFFYEENDFSGAKEILENLKMFMGAYDYSPPEYFWKLAEEVDKGLLRKTDILI